VGAIFRAPLAGALFAGEILYKDADLESDVIVPSAIASIVSYSVYSLSLSDAKRFAPLFGDVPDYGFVSLVHLLPLVLLAVVLVLVGVLYIKVFHHTQSLFARLPVAPCFRLAIGTLIAGCLAVALYSVMGNDYRTLSVLSTGYGALQDALNPHDGVAVKLFLLIAFVKILTTSLTLGSGGSAGLFGPSMVIGGCVGVAVGSWLHAYSPTLVPEPGLYAIVGMAGFFAGTAHFDDHHGLGNDGRILAAAADDVGFDAVHVALSTLDDLSASGADTHRVAGASGRFHCRCARRHSGRGSLSARCEYQLHSRIDVAG
jgi:CIC family chloride channel protein